MSPAEIISADIDREHAERELQRLEIMSLQSQMHAFGARMRVLEMALQMGAVRDDIHADELVRLQRRFEALQSSIEGLVQP